MFVSIKPRRVQIDTCLVVHILVTISQAFLLVAMELRITFLTPYKFTRTSLSLVYRFTTKLK